jgi:hypothetical protein
MTSYKFRVAIFLLSFFIPLVVLAQDAENNDTPQLIEYIVTAETANLRAEASTSADIVVTVSNGETLLVYDEDPSVEGWLRIFRDDEPDAYIADFLVERAPIRFYPVDQEPIAVVSGSGSNITEVYDFPQGAYRIDATVQDNAFILQTVIVEGDCRDDTIFNELNFDTNRLTMSGLFVSSGCSVLFQTDNVDGSWEFEIRDILDEAVLVDNLFEIEDGSTISGSGRTLTMATMLAEGIWTITTTVNDNAFILRAHVLLGDCDDGSVFNEFVDGDTLELSTAYRNTGEACVIFWETSNVEGAWAFTFEKLR